MFSGKLRSIILAYNATEKLKSPIPVSHLLIFCCRNSILHQPKKKIKKKVMMKKENKKRKQKTKQKNKRSPKTIRKHKVALFILDSSY